MSTHRDYTDRREWNWAKDKIVEEREREAMEEVEEIVPLSANGRPPSFEVGCSSSNLDDGTK